MVWLWLLLAVFGALCLVFTRSRRRLPVGWSEQVVFITGGSNGIGSSLVLQFLGRGCHVYNMDLEESKELSHEPRYQYLRGDVSREESIRSCVSQVARPISILVNNAGVWSGGLRFTQLSGELIERTIATNLIGPMLLANLLLKKFRLLFIVRAWFHRLRR